MVVALSWIQKLCPGFLDGRKEWGVLNKGTDRAFAHPLLTPWAAAIQAQPSPRGCPADLTHPCEASPWPRPFILGCSQGCEQRARGLKDRSSLNGIRICICTFRKGFQSQKSVISLTWRKSPNKVPPQLLEGGLPDPFLSGKTPVQFYKAF